MRVGDAGLSLDPLGDRHVVAGLGRIAGVGGDAAGRDADEVEALAFSALAMATASSGVSPPSRQSLPVMRAPSGTLFGTTARTARAIESGKRMRFSSEPPYWSVRLLEIGDMKPCAR